PTLEQLQVALSLTDAQAATIRPILEANLKAQQDLTGLQSTAANLRAALNDKIGAVLSDTQKPLLAQVLNPAPAARGGRGAGGAAANNPPFPNGANSWQEAALSLG